jgi:hypothetical protein
MSYRQEQSNANIIMTIILGVLVIICLSVMKYEHDMVESKKVFDVYATIIEINGQDVAYVGKGSVPTNTNTVLFKVVKDGYSDTYFKLSQHNSFVGQAILTDSWIYNHRVGDTVHFEFISSDRFFKIERK